MKTPAKTTRPKAAAAAGARTRATRAIAETAGLDEESAVIAAEPDAPASVVPVLRKRAIVEAVAERTGLRKRAARQAVEAAFDVVAEALRAGDAVEAGSLGKLRVTRRGGTPGAERLVLRTRLSPPAEAGSEPLAETGEDG